MTDERDKSGDGAGEQGEGGGGPPQLNPEGVVERQARQIGLF